MVPFITTLAAARGMSETMGLAGHVYRRGQCHGTNPRAPGFRQARRTRAAIVCAFIASAACAVMIFARGAAFVVGIFFIAAYGGTSHKSGHNHRAAWRQALRANYGLVLISIGASSIVFEIAAVVALKGTFPLRFYCAAWYVLSQCR